jgi:hypothetical protein
LCEVHLAFNEVDRLFFSSFESQWSMIDHGPTYWRKASHTFYGRDWFFWAYRRLFE